MSGAKYRVYICCGRNCGPKGSRQLVDFLEDEVERLALQERVVVYPGGCQDHCESGPTMVVYPGPIFYQEVDRKRIRRIVTEHFAEDKPVAEYFWIDTGRPRTYPRPSNVTFKPTFLAPQAPSKPPGKTQEPGKPATKKRYEVDDFKW